MKPARLSEAVPDSEFEGRRLRRLGIAEEIPKQLHLGFLQDPAFDGDDLTDPHQAALLPGTEAWDLARTCRWLVVVFEAAAEVPGLPEMYIRKRAKSET